MLGKVQSHRICNLPCSVTCSATQKSMNPSKSGGFTALNVQPHPFQRSWVRLRVPALWSLQYPVPSWSFPRTPPSYLISIKWCDQKVLPRTTDIPVTQETENCSSQQRTGQRSNTFRIHRICKYDPNFFLFWSLKKTTIILHVYIIHSGNTCTHPFSSCSHPMTPTSPPLNFHIFLRELFCFVVFPPSFGEKGGALYHQIK